jgi:penicillin-binding protein 1A
VKLNKKIKKRIIISLLAAAGICFVTGVIAFFWLIVFFPGDKIDQSNIEKVLAIESPVFYKGGSNRIGVFFKEDHRQYVPYEKMPKHFVDAIIASEDHEFFSHYGVDFFGIARAMLANLRAGRVVQGGSTLTQQTAKNLFKRQKRSIKSKLKELLYAWRLEYHYSKEKILEFYANQFYVSGNGRGLGVASRYYFNKPVNELSLLESAFIAGSVKQPNHYNPFIKKNDADVEEALGESKRRVSYVLGQMYKLKLISAKEYQLNLGAGIPFEQGRMYYSLNTIMDLVRKALAEPVVEEALRRKGIENVATSGIKIFTTIEEDWQESSFFALRKELSRLDLRLRGYDREKLQKKYSKLIKKGHQKAELGKFLFGRVEEINLTEKKPFIRVSFRKLGNEIGNSGFIDQKSIMTFLGHLVKFQHQRWTEAEKKDLKQLKKIILPGDLVYVSIRDEDPLSGNFFLDLEKYPVIQGAAMAIKDGTIRAMSGGVDNKFFNRATSARRPMGSTIKPLVYAAAVQLGWNSIDLLNNERRMFVYQNKPYFPRPDHQSPNKWVSMSWAGVHSENLASVWLLYHLCDQLTPAQFKELISHVDMARKDDETHNEYKRKIRDEFGIVVDRNVLYQVAFERAVREAEPDLLFAGKNTEYELLDKFYYRAEFKNLKIIPEDSENPDKKEDKRKKKKIKLNKEQKLKLKLLSQNYVGYMQKRQALMAVRAGLLDLESKPKSTSRFDPEQPVFKFFQITDEKNNIETEKQVSDREEGQGKIIFTDLPPEKNWQHLPEEDLVLLYNSLAEMDQEEFWANIIIDNILSISTLETINEIMEQEFKKLSSKPPYSFAVLSQVPDFKIMASIRYLVELCNNIGITSKLDPVLSFPLGSNVLTLYEVGRIYEALSKGKIVFDRTGESRPELFIIDHIKNSEDEIIYQPDRFVRKIIAPKTSLSVNDILQNVVRHGTGRLARRAVRIHSRDPQRENYLRELDLKVPVLGKTGTANHFTNAAFAGIVPGKGNKSGAVTLEEGTILTTYAGFDNNLPMVRTSTHITGSSGALPLWATLANDIMLKREYSEKIDLDDFSFSGSSELSLKYQEIGQISVAVDKKKGGIPVARTDSSFLPGIKSKKNAEILTFGSYSDDGLFEPERNFQPYWKIQEEIR